jgi:hypothetical protein
MQRLVGDDGKGGDAAQRRCYSVLTSWFPDSSISAPTRPPLHQEAAVSDRRLQFSSVVCRSGKRKRSASGSTKAGVEATAGLARLITTVPHCRLIHALRRGCYSLLSGGSHSGGGGLLRRTGA